MVGGKATTLFDFFNTHLHTVLIFTPPGQQDFARQVIKAAHRHPGGTIQLFTVTREGGIVTPGAFALADKDGFAHSSHLVKDDEVGIVGVRPDSLVGTVTRDAAGFE